MSAEQYASFSNYAVASATLVLALAALAYIVEWAYGRNVVAPMAQQVPSNTANTAGTDTVVAVDPGTGDPAQEKSEIRAAMAGGIGLALTGLGFVILLAGVVTRGLAADRVPWGNMWEFSMTGSVAVLAVFLVLVRTSDLNWLGGPITGFVVVLLGLSTQVYVEASPLVPALHSYWLVVHVAAVMLAGGGFLVGAALSILYLVKSRAERRTPDPADRRGYLWRLPTSNAMDRLAYRVHAFAFPLWTFGALIAGPIWAQYAWGRYWGWDPKEVWAFITWVAYAGYLHARATAGWKGKAAAVLALIAFASFMFNYVGVNLFVDGLHSYAK